MLSPCRVLQNLRLLAAERAKLTSMTSPSASQERPRRGSRLRDLKSVPVLPSLITLGNLFLGFLVMAISIFLTGILDGSLLELEELCEALHSDPCERLLRVDEAPE